MSSAAGAKVGTIYPNGKVVISVRASIIEIGHPQDPTPLKTDNNTADGFFNKKIKPKRSESFDMKFYWVLDQIKKNNFERNGTNS